MISMQKEAGKMKIGVLSIQGGVSEHIHHIEALGHEAIKVKNVYDIKCIDGLILPGGESTAISKILRDSGLEILIKDRINAGIPVWGTCAGMILLAKEIENEDKAHLAVMDIKVRRNAYGSQVDSFSKDEVIEEVSDKAIPLVFIRAPYITGIGEGVRVVHKVDGNVVAVIQKKMLATSFHPELTKNLEFHKYFINMCMKL